MAFRGELPELTNYTFGTANINETNNPEHAKVARAAMEAGVWFHTSVEYGKGAVFEVLKAAFAEDRAGVPHCIFKIHSRNPDSFRESVTGAIAGTGVERVDIAQVCGRPSVAELQPGEPLHDTMCELKEQGLVGSYVLEFFRPSTADSIRAVADDLFDGYIYYYNVIDREVSNELYDLMQSKGSAVLGLRTVGGGAGSLGYAGDRGALLPAMKKAIDELCERSGCASEIEFRMRFPLSEPNVRTTIGATTKLEHLDQYLRILGSFEPLAAEIVEEIQTLHREWFAE